MTFKISSTGELLLKLMSAVYMVAFLSLYLQIPGLYGENGVLPAHTQLSVNGTAQPAVIWARPTLLWWRGLLGLKMSPAMELLAIVGVVLSLLAMLFQVFRNTVTFALLLVFYASLVQVGQVFLFYQWDTLLMEAGLLAVLLAPLLPNRESNVPSSDDRMALWLFRWLLFRVLFSTGLVKLQSHCPAWWGLTALETHFESQSLPSPLAFYAHHLPQTVLRLSTVLSVVTEVAAPFMIFAPVRKIRTVGLYMQVFLLLNMLATGNFGFHTVLMLVLCVSLLDEDRRQDQADAGGFGTVLTWVFFSGFVLATVGLFDIRPSTTEGLTARIAFSKSDFANFTALAVPASILLATASLLLTAAEAVVEANAVVGGTLCRRADRVMKTVGAVVMTAAVFSCTLVPYSMLDLATHRSLPRVLRTGFSANIQTFHVFGSYGLFQQMTGVGGRPEVVLEGADSLNGPWQELEFRYKPGDVTTAPAFVAPHQPRLDWQMWISALGDYHSNPWLTSLAYRLLTGQPEAIRLLDETKYSFAEKPPKYIRGLLYKYHYTALDGANNSWWRRDPSPVEYLPIFSADHQPLIDYLREIKVIDNPEPEPAAPCSMLIGALAWIRSWIDQSATPPHVLIWTLLLAGLAVDLIHRYII